MTLALLLVGSVLAGDEAPRRVRLFDRMDEAAVGEAGAPAAAEAATPAAAAATTLPLGFEPGFARPAWVARRIGRDVRFEQDAWSVAELTAEGGATGGALRLGPGLQEDGSYLCFLVPARPLERVVVRGRVRLTGHPSPDVASAREVIGVVEHAGEIVDPSRFGRFAASAIELHRGTRLREPGDWDRFEVELPLTDARAGTLEIRLVHRSGGSAEAATWFDDVEIESRPLPDAAVWEQLLAGTTPTDRNAAATPWRRRVTLPDHEFVKETTKDCVLLPPGRRLAFPLVLPEAAAAPRLRLSYAMLPRCFGIPGDGARIDVTFTPEGGAAQPLAALELDPKNDPQQRCWLHAVIDLTPVAGRRGTLAFATHDVGEPDRFDGVVLANPRIEPRDEPPAGWNVLVIASDTLRADRLSAFGYDRPTSPHVERLAAGGIVFAQARSQAPWTLPSFSSILTSQYPSQHGAGRGGHDEWTPLEPGMPTLADALARVGYECAGITANHLISPEYGLDQGFESYAVPGEGQWMRTGMESVELDAPLVERFLEEHVATPFFLFWHIMDPHLPYTTDAALRREFTDADYDGRFQGRNREVPFQVLDPRPGRRWFTHEGPPKPPPLSDADRRFVSDYYDAEVAEIDRAIGRVVDALQRTGLWERTIVALVADHGEGLGDHGHYHHGYTLFDDQVHIPLLVRVPGRDEGSVRAEPVQSIDLAPTLLAALRLPAQESFAGADLLAEGGRGEQPVFLEYPSYDSSAEKGVLLGRFKYLHDPWFHTEALFDVLADPRETKDVKGEHPEVVARSRALLDEFRWEHLQRGRFHLRVHGRPGAKLRVALRTDDLFDANFAARPAPPERDFALDLERRNLVLETTMSGERLELVCWCRGHELALEVTLDGEPLAQGVVLGAEGEARALPLRIARDAVPVAEGAGLAPPKPGGALFWMERGAGNAAPVVPSPAELEKLRALGYAH